MTPQERQLIDDLFDRLAKLESAKRDPEAMSAIMEGLRTAPNAVYALVQTALVQDEALKRADLRIQELEAAAGQPNQQAQGGGFLDSMRDAIFGQNQPQGSYGQGSQGSVPNVRAPDMGSSPGGSRPAWNTGQVLQQPQGGGYNQPAYGQPYGGAQQQQPSAFGGGGGSFLGTAAAAAAGVVGGSILASSIRSMMAATSRRSAIPDTAAASRTAGRGAISPAAISRARPASTISARRAGARIAAATMTTARARDSSTRRRMTMTTRWITIPTALTATMATAITRKACVR
jgi:hypothetical protein